MLNRAEQLVVATLLGDDPAVRRLQQADPSERFAEQVLDLGGFALTNQDWDVAEAAFEAARALAASVPVPWIQLRARFELLRIDFLHAHTYDELDHVYAGLTAIADESRNRAVPDEDIRAGIVAADAACRVLEA